jgi:hypothetical protein
VVDGTLHRYPGADNFRAVFSARFGEERAGLVSGWAPPPVPLAELVAAHHRLLAANPWAGVSPASAVVRLLFHDGRWRAVDAAGYQAPVVGNDLDLWRLHGLLAARPGQVLGEWSPDGLRPTSLATVGGLLLL